MDQRIQYDRPNNYSNKVLVGTWFNDRLNAEAPVSPKHSVTTSYDDDFGVKPPSRIDPAVMWDQKLNSEDSNFIPQIGRHDFPNYFENFSSTYDLSYNHFPKCFKSCIPRTLRFRLCQFEPTDDYLPSFGNLTGYGLKQYKNEEWHCGVQDPRQTYSTHYRDTFIAPDNDDYKFKRHATPLTNSSRVNPINCITLSLQLRGRPTCNVTPSHELTEVCRPEAPNPITWENKQISSKNCI